MCNYTHVCARTRFISRYLKLLIMLKMLISICIDGSDEMSFIKICIEVANSAKRIFYGDSSSRPDYDPRARHDARLTLQGRPHFPIQKLGRRSQLQLGLGRANRRDGN